MSNSQEAYNNDNQDELVSTFIEVELSTPESFLVVKETLTRIGIGVRKNNTLYPSCLILHKKGKMYIVHFKEMFLLDRKPTDFSENDRERRNTIAYLLHEWGLLKVKDLSKIENRVPVSKLKIVPFKEKHLWTVRNKYSLGQQNQNGVS
jgi:hypothetical protein